jgi:hypothetical protein
MRLYKGTNVCPLNSHVNTLDQLVLAKYVKRSGSGWTYKETKARIAGGCWWMLFPSGTNNGVGSVVAIMILYHSTLN